MGSRGGMDLKWIPLRVGKLLAHQFLRKPIALVFALLFLARASARSTADTAGLPEAPLRWVPFTATQHESSSWVIGVQAIGSQYFDSEFTGIFARNES